MKNFCLFLALSIAFSLPALAQEQLSIPRFVSFKLGEVNLRTGPGDRFPIKYVYRQKHYPVEIIDEYELWRQIREVDGTIGWVHRRMLTGVRYALITKEASLLKKPQENAKTKAIVQKNVLGKIESCPAQSDFCEITFDFDEKKIKGWMKKDTFFGVYPNEVVK